MPEFKRVQRFIWGLAPQIRSMVTSSKPSTIAEAIDLSVTLTEEALRIGKFSESQDNKKETHVESSGNKKRKYSNLKMGTQVSYGSSKANKRKKVNPPHGRKADGATNKAGGKAYLGTKPRCGECNFHHEGRGLRPKCVKCGKEGHSKDACWAKDPDKRNKGRVPGCYRCGEAGHFRKDCPRQKQVRKGFHNRNS
ncbi:cold shock protein 1-like [Helianthus annuus]|uniref:cold shock protein 1-like n=1 Tax=Helianthus annuus TaxID=4232 RepID=UPI001652FEBA|nr:cold shock protein 1-like [Helianthus annuus]